MTTVAAKGVAQATGIAAAVAREMGTAEVTATETVAVVEMVGEVAGRAVEVMKAAKAAEIAATVIRVVGIAAGVVAAVRAMEMAGAKVVGGLEAAAVVRELGTVAAPAQVMEPAAEMPEVAGEMAEPAVAPAKGLGMVAVVEEAPELAVRAVGALELAIIRVPGPVPAKAMQAEAALVPEALGALEALAVRPATTAAENPEERRLQHPCPQHQTRQAQQVRAQHRPE
jgi:hypothetical protein